MGGDPIKLGENANVYLQHDGIEYEITPEPPVTLEVANNMKLSLPEGVELKDGDSAIITIKNDRRNKIIYRKELLEDS